MGAVADVLEVRPDNKDLPLKNRVGGSRAPARSRIRKSASQAAESRRENRPTPTNIASGIRYFLLTDQVGTLRAVADSTGMIVKRIDYDSFGNIIADSNLSFTVPFGFAGGLHDRDTGLVRFGYRDYSPELGRFVAKDPIDFAGGDPNLYGYVFGDPVNGADPLGQAAHIIINRTGSKGQLTVINSGAGQLINIPVYDAGPGSGADPYGTGYQIPPGYYTVSPRPIKGDHYGRPTISNTGSWNDVITPSGTRRSGIQFHRGSKPAHSGGCEVTPRIGDLRDMIDGEYEDGVDLLIIDNGMFDLPVVIGG